MNLKRLMEPKMLPWLAAALLVGLIAKQLGKLLMRWKLEGEPAREKTAG